MGNGKERDETGRDFPHPRVRAVCLIRNQVSRLVDSEPNRSTRKKTSNVDSLGGSR
jgi:hypothetical protein